ncbi:STE3-domain-containing protein [Trametopsis cervina]|nr:STE3-domain-containing protein [Trametopsis cervina]
MSDPLYPAYTVIAFITAFIVLIPLPWHLQAWNAGTCLFMIWTSISCLNLAINSILFHSTAVDLAPVWCDISSRLLVAQGVAIPAASLCINRRLYKIASISSVARVTHAEKRRSVLVDMAIGLGIPLLQIVMQYIVSGHRYDIFEDIGCLPFTYNTPVAYPLSIVWPVVIGLVSALYCILTLRAFFKRRVQFNQFLSRNNSLTANRYFRLMGLATTELLCTTPIAAYGMWLNIQNSPISPWISWADTHFNYSQVDQYPALLWRASRNTVISFEMTRWSPVFCGIVFFAFFGFAGEARRHYREIFVHARTTMQRPFKKVTTGKQCPDSPLPSYAVHTDSVSLTFKPQVFMLDKFGEKGSPFDITKSQISDSDSSTIV